MQADGSPAVGAKLEYIGPDPRGPYRPLKPSDEEGVVDMKYPAWGPQARYKVVHQGSESVVEGKAWLSDQPESDPSKTIEALTQLPATDAVNYLMVKIWIDADAAPQDVKQVVFRAAKRLNLETILVANQPVGAPPAYTMVRSVTVREGADQADRYMVKHSAPGDVAITADLPLAADLVAKGIVVIDPRGEAYSAANIAGRLSMRNFMDELRGGGMTIGGQAPYGATDKKAFAATLDRLLAQAMRRPPST